MWYGSTVQLFATKNLHHDISIQSTTTLHHNAILKPNEKHPSATQNFKIYELPNINLPKKHFLSINNISHEWSLKNQHKNKKNKPNRAFAWAKEGHHEAQTESHPKSETHVQPHHDDFKELAS